MYFSTRMMFTDFFVFCFGILARIGSKSTPVDRNEGVGGAFD